MAQEIVIIDGQLMIPANVQNTDFIGAELGGIKNRVVFHNENYKFETNAGSNDGGAFPEIMDEPSAANICELLSGLTLNPGDVIKRFDDEAEQLEWLNE